MFGRIPLIPSGESWGDFFDIIRNIPVHIFRIMWYPIIKEKTDNTATTKEDGKTTKITNIDADITCKRFKTALDRFMRKYPGHEE